MRKSHQITVLFVALASVLCLSSRSAFAFTDHVTVDKTVKHYTLYAHHKQPATFTFTSQVMKKIEPTDWKAKLVVEPTADVATLYVFDGLKKGDIVGQFTIATRMYNFVVTVIAADAADKAAAAILVEHKPLLEVVKAAAEQISQEKVQQARQEMELRLAAKEQAHAEEVEQVRREAEKTKRESGEATLLVELEQHESATSLRGSGSCSGTGIVVCRQKWTQLQTYGVLRYMVSNRSGAGVEFVYVQVHNQHGERDHAGLVRVGDAAPVSSQDMQVKLASGESVFMSVSVRNPKQIGGKVKLALGMAGRSLPAFKTIDLDPEPKEGEGLIMVGVQGIAGAVWLANPVDPGQLGATSAAGLEMRLRYGFNQHLSVEASLAGARSGTASWDGMTYANQEGMISRDATVGRFLANGLLHFGDKYRPLLRAGLGFQGVDHGSRFVPVGGAEQAGPPTNFELAGLWTVGVGFEAKISQHWTAGLGAMFVGVATSTSSSAGLKTSFEGGFHLSYGLTP